MKIVKALGIVLVLSFVLSSAAYGALSLVLGGDPYQGVKNLYGDWQFVRQQRIVYLRNKAAQEQREKAAPQGKVLTPLPPDPPAAPPAPPKK